MPGHDGYPHHLIARQVRGQGTVVASGPGCAAPLPLLLRLYRRVLRRLALAAWAFGPWLASGRSFQGCAVLLEFACSIGGFVSMLFARVRGEPPWQGNLNGWDEALAFVAVSRLAHLAAHSQA